MPKVTIYHGDTRDVLTNLPSKKYMTCVTSPPYWKLRQYDTVDGQIGWEDTPEQFTFCLKEVFDALYPTLRDDGTCWIVIGDSYTQGGRGAFLSYTESKGEPLPPLKLPKDYQRKNLVGIPWRLAFALQGFSVVSQRDLLDITDILTDAVVNEDMEKVKYAINLLMNHRYTSQVLNKYYFRNEIIWEKPNPSPEMAKDRLTRAHETIIFLSKNAKYYYDIDALREPYSQVTVNRSKYAVNEFGGNAGDPSARLAKGSTGGSVMKKVDLHPDGTPKRTVWQFPTESCKVGHRHFAVYPVALVETCLKAALPPYICSTCGNPWQRQFNEDKSTKIQNGIPVLLPDCDCDRPAFVRERPTVIDPFGGTGTTAIAAIKHGFDCVLIDNSLNYCKQAFNRIKLVDPMFTKVELIK